MSLKRQTVWSMLPLLVVTVVNVFSVPLFYRYLGAELYALWFYVITFTGLFGFADLGIGVAIGRYVGMALGQSDVPAAREYWGTGNLIALLLLLVMALVFTGLGVGFGPKWFNVSAANEDLSRACFLVGGGSLFFSYYSQLWIVLVQTHLDFKFSSLLRVAASLFQVLPAIGLAWATHSPLWICLWMMLVAIGQLAVTVWYVRRKYRLGFDFGSFRWERAREMAAYTGKTFAALVVGSVFASVDRLVLGKLAAAADFAHYVICGNVGNRLQGLSVAVMGPVFHNTNRAAGGGRMESAAAIYDDMFHFMFGWYLLVAIWVGVWHQQLLHLWLGRELGAAVAPLFPPVVGACCITAIANISAAQLSALNRMGASLGFTVVTGLLTVLGVYLGWYWGGLIGVAYGFLCSRVGCLIQDVFVMRWIKAEGWLGRETWKLIAAQGLVGGVFAGVKYFSAAEALWLLAVAALHFGLVAGWLLRHPLRRLVGARAA